MEASFSGKAGYAILGAKVVDAAAVPVFVAAGLTKVGYWRFFGWTAAATVPKAALLMVVGFFAGQQALDLIQRLAPGPTVLLALLIVAPIGALVVSRKVSKQIPTYAKYTAIEEENR